MNYKLLALILSTSFFFLVAMILGIGQLFFMLAILLGILIIAYLISLFSVRGLECRRIMPVRISEGQTIEVKLKVRNLSWLPKFFFRLKDSLPRWLEPQEEGYFYIDLWRQNETTVSYLLEAKKRGVYKLGPIEIVGSDPLGIFERKVELPVFSEVIVYPATLEIPLISQGSLGPYESSLPEGLKGLGEGIDFYGLREYQPGDELRRIHWKSTARLGRFVVVEFEKVASPDIHLVLDLSKGTDIGEGKETTLEYAIKIAASLAQEVLFRHQSLYIFGNSASANLPKRCHSVPEALECLARLEADGNLLLEQIASEICEKLSPGCGIVLLASSIHPTICKFAHQLQAHGIEVAAVLLNANSFSINKICHEEKLSQFARQLATSGATVYLINRGVGIAAQLEVPYLASVR